MTLAEYYGFPNGTNCVRKYYNLIDDGADYPFDNMTDLFTYETRKYLPNLKNQQPTNITSLCNFCSKLVSTHGLQYLDTSKCTTLNYTFQQCSGLKDLSYIDNWDTSNVSSMSNTFNFSGIKHFDANWSTAKVTSMEKMFYYCTSLTTLVIKGNTSRVTTMDSMLYYCQKLTSISAIDCSSIAQNKYPLYGYSNYTALTDVGGFLNMKSSWDNSNGLYRCPNLTYESCINILNGLYNFSGNNQTPSSSQGKLKVHANFLTAVGDEISIATEKGWTITT